MSNLTLMGSALCGNAIKGSTLFRNNWDTNLGHLEQGRTTLYEQKLGSFDSTSRDIFLIYK